MTFYLFIDDIRDPNWSECVASGVDQSKPWVIARSSREAIMLVEEHGMPNAIAFDHDLGYHFNDPKMGIDTTIIFLRWLTEHFWDGTQVIPSYTIHSSNGPGRENIRSIMESWKKSLTI